MINLDQLVPYCPRANVRGTLKFFVCIVFTKNKIPANHHQVKNTSKKDTVHQSTKI